MAILRPLRTLLKVGYPSEVHISARAEIGDTGAVGTVHGRYVTFARTGTGVYTATVSNTGGLPDYLFAQAEVVGTTAVLKPRVSVNTSTGVFTITVEDASGTDTDPASGTSLCFRCVVVNSNIVSA